MGEAATGLNYKIYVTESLRAAAFSSDGVRSGRQNGAKAVAENLAVSGRLGYSGIPGLDIAGSFFLGNTGQDLADSARDLGIDKSDVKKFKTLIRNYRRALAAGKKAFEAINRRASL